MKKMLPLLLALVLLASSAFADQPLRDEPEADSVIPSNAEFVRNTIDDGLSVSRYRTPDGTQYEVKAEPATGRTVRVEIEAVDNRGAETPALSREQAEAALLALFPDASVYLVTPERDDGRYE